MHLIITQLFKQKLHCAQTYTLKPKKKIIIKLKL